MEGGVLSPEVVWLARSKSSSTIVDFPTFDNHAMQMQLPALVNSMVKCMTMIDISFGICLFRARCGRSIPVF